MGIKYHGISAKILPYVQPPLLSKNISELGFFLGAGGGGWCEGRLYTVKILVIRVKKMNIKQIKISVNITYSFHTSSTEDAKWSEQEIDVLRDPTFLQKVANIEVELFGRFFQLKL